MNNVIAYIAGLILAVGLTCSRMTDPHKIIAFLDVTGAWDPALLFVMGGAIPVWGVFRANMVITKRHLKQRGGNAATT